MKIYEATARREEKFWVVHVHGLPVKGSGVTQGRTWKEAHSMAVDLVASLLDVPADSFSVVLTHEDRELAAALHAAEEARALAEYARKKAAAALERAALLLTNVTTVRDAGDILDLSHQQVAKIASRGRG